MHSGSLSKASLPNCRMKVKDGGRNKAGGSGHTDY